ncbi:Rho-associated protein kinase 1 [Schistosoma japonicum]|nr:Rho-associated protein kinase 1 [Schistosoma japonicum]
MTSSDNLPLNELEKELLDPNSECYLENLLDVVSALVTDCDFPSAKNSKSVQSFLKKYSQAAKIIESRRTKYNDFELIKVIGQGGFGRVELARHKRTRRVYAIKLMSKQHLLDHSQSGYWEERDVMVKASSEWLVACHYAFLDKDNVYLCMEYMPGGDLYYWLEKYDTFDETIARFYLAEIVLALEALHQLGFIHRDLKPDNMLLDAAGHLKLADFGSCVRVGVDGYYYCTSPIGTPDYISPEMLSCQSKAGKIGPACDWWALGVIAYEMFFGEPAFYGQSLVETYSRILAHEKSLRIPTDADPISPETELFIKDLLKSSTTRLGSFDLLTETEIKAAKNNRAVAAAHQVKSHVFFKSINWEQLRSENPPIQPVVNSETDTSNINFDERDLSSDSSSGGGGGAKLPHSGGAFAPARPQPPAYFTGSNLSFAGFTFNRYHRYLEMFSRPVNNNNTVQPAADSYTSDVKTNHQTMLNEALERQKLVEETLSELKQAYQSLECQAAKDQVSLKDVNRRLIESHNELDQLKSVKLESDRQLTDMHAQLTSAQYERERLQSEIKELETRCQSVVVNLESERRDNSILKTEKEHLEHRVIQLERNLKQKTSQLIASKSVGENAPTVDGGNAILQDNNDTIIAQQNELISNLKTQNNNLLAENQEAQDKCTALMNVVSDLRRNLEEQVKELTEQLQTAQELNHINVNKYKETYDLLEQTKMSEENLRRDLVVTKENLEASIHSRRSVEEQLVYKESELAVAEVRLRSLETNLSTVRKHSENEVLRLNNLLERNTIEMNDLSQQLDEMRSRCASTEKTNGLLTERVQQLQKDKEIQQRNLDTLVEKFYSEMKSRTIQPPVKAKNVNRDEYKQLEKKYKNLQSTSQKDIANLHATIDQYKKDLAERNNHITSLTEECQTIYKELGQQRQLERNLRARLDYYVHAQQSTPIKDSNLECKSSTVIKQSDDTDATDILIQSQNIDSTCGISMNLLNIVLEDIVDIDSKGRGKNKLIWLPKYAVLKRFSLLFYASRAERESNPSLAEEIPLYRIMHVREATELDLIHAKKEDLSRTIQLFYQNQNTKIHQQSNLFTNNDDTDMDLHDATFVSSLQTAQLPQHQSTFKLSSRLNQDAVILTNTTTNNNSSNSNNNNTTIEWMNHNFQLMRFHLGNVLCDICHKNCSDLLNPPKALECLHCRMRIHFDHVDRHEKFASCHNAANVRYLRMSNSAARKVWIEQLISLRQCLRELHQNPDQLLDTTSGGLSNLDCNQNSYSSNNIVHMNSIKSIYRSMRAGSLGPTSVPINSAPTASNQKSDFQYSFRRNFVGQTGIITGGVGMLQNAATSSSTPSSRNNLSPRSLSPTLVFPKVDNQ